MTMTQKTSEYNRARVQHYLLYQGHACPTVEGDEVLYANRNPGFKISLVRQPMAEILLEIGDMTLRQIEDHLDADRIMGEMLRERATRT
jgi:hypothetical protein